MESDPPDCSDMKDQDGTGNSSPNVAARDIKYEGEYEFEDIAEAYGNEIDGFSDNDDDDRELGDSSLCSICDDGGHLLLCDGPCMRSFHASKDFAASSLSRCKSLGLKADDIKKKNWYCLNCKYGQQQCFICGRLGRSKGENQQVFVCDVALCGRFYHAHCLGEWKEREVFNGIVDRNAFIRSVKQGEGFCCPAHNCRRCGEGEEEGVDDKMKFVKCRRCPKAFHKTCLPLKICFHSCDGMPIRAWKVGRQLLMYCKKHEIIPELLTPARNHLEFPAPSLPCLRRQKLTTASPLKLELSSLKRKREMIGKALSLKESTTKMPKDPSLKQKDSDRELDMIQFYFNSDEKIANREVDMTRLFSRVEQKRQKTSEKEVSRTQYIFKAKPVEKEVNRTPWQKTIEEQEEKYRLKENSSRDSRGHNLIVEEQSVGVAPLFPSTDLEKRIQPEKKNPASREGRQFWVRQLMDRAKGFVRLQDVRQTLARISCYGERRENGHGSSGEIISAITAGRKALAVLNTGGSTEYAKRLCTKDSLDKLLRTEKMLRIYLAPLVHGVRYTSFGRHFTRTDKLQEIVERIHPYIDSGDMVVDFCCGSNDFSVLLDRKLRSTGKSCEFRNFDIHPPKDTFCFTKGDWFEQTGQDFLDGRRLIMGLNPPFGFQASLADKFILHALKFRPKLLVLIVPPETMNSSKGYQAFNYHRVWVDDALLRGSSFYFPGSLDRNGNEKVPQWNNVTPPLFLWSTAEMIGKHRQIALRLQHISVSCAHV